jgi:hypothetical protein
MKNATKFEVVQQNFGGGNHVTRIANHRGNPSRRSSHSDVRRLVSSQFSNGKFAWGYTDNPLRHDLWRAGHAGVYLVLSLVMLRYVDEAVLSPFWKWLARIGAPIAAILIPAAFFLSAILIPAGLFLSVLSPTHTVRREEKALDTLISDG